MFSPSTLVSSMQEKIPSLLSFLPEIIIGFIQKHIVLSFLLLVSCLFTIEFFVTPVYVQGESEAYNMQIFEGGPDLTKKITYFGLISEKKIREFLGVPQPIKEKQVEKHIDASTNTEKVGLVFGGSNSGLRIDRSSIGQIGTYSKYLIFMKLGAIILVLLSAYVLGSRWGVLLSFITFFMFTGIDFWRSLFVSSEMQDIVDINYNGNHVLIKSLLFSEKIFLIVLTLIFLAGVYYFFSSFRKKAV